MALSGGLFFRRHLHDPADSQDSKHYAAGIAAVSHDDVDKRCIGNEKIDDEDGDTGCNADELVFRGFFILDKGGNACPEDRAESAVDGSENADGKYQTENCGSGSEDAVRDQKIRDGCLGGFGYISKVAEAKNTDGQRDSACTDQTDHGCIAFFVDIQLLADRAHVSGYEQDRASAEGQTGCYRTCAGLQYFDLTALYEGCAFRNMREECECSNDAENKEK